jgi:hypothetical protein
LEIAVPITTCAQWIVAQLRNDPPRARVLLRVLLRRVAVGLVLGRLVVGRALKRQAVVALGLLRLLGLQGLLVLRLINR